MKVRNTCAEFNGLMSISNNPKVIMVQHEQLFIVSFLVGLAPKYEMAKDQVLSSSKISSLEEATSRYVINDGKGNKGVGSNSSKGYLKHQRTNSEDVVCYYYYKPDHTDHKYRKLFNKGQRVPTTSLDRMTRYMNISSTPKNFER